MHRNMVFNLNHKEEYIITMDAIYISTPPVNDCIRGVTRSFHQCLILTDDKNYIGTCFSLSIYNFMICIDKVNKTTGNNK